MTHLDYAYRNAKRLLVDAGYRVSAASWIDYIDRKAYACTVETVPNTLGHPMAEISIRTSDKGDISAYKQGSLPNWIA